MKRSAKNFVGVDVGLNLLIRQAMYGAYYEVVVANNADLEGAETYDIVGTDLRIRRYRCKKTAGCQRLNRAMLPLCSILALTGSR